MVDSEEIESRFQAIQDQICAALITYGDPYREDRWSYDKGSGGGITRVWEGAGMLEKGGVNFSAIRGSALPASASTQFQIAPDTPFLATGVSLVLHPWNPLIPGSARIGLGDLLAVSINSGLKEESSRPFEIRVAHDGTLLVPLVGDVPVAGMEPEEAGRQIAEIAIRRGVYRQPYVTVQSIEQAMNHVTVLGAVTKPGSYKLARGSSDLISALAAAGGLTDEASTQIDIVHQQTPTFLAGGQGPAAQGETAGGIQLASFEGGENTPETAAANAAATASPTRTVRVDLAMAQQAAGESLQLGERAVVMVHAREEQVIHVTGLVKRPDQFELPQGTDVRLLDAVALAGGISSPVADKVIVIRQLKNMPEPLTIQASLSKAKRNPDLENVRLAAGDLVSVEATPATVIVDTASRVLRASFGFSSRVVAF